MFIFTEHNLVSTKSAGKTERQGFCNMSLDNGYG